MWEQSRELNTFKYIAAPVEKSWRSMQVVQHCYISSAIYSIVILAILSLDKVKSFPWHSRPCGLLMFGPSKLVLVSEYTMLCIVSMPSFQEALIPLSHLVTGIRLLWVQVQLHSLFLQASDCKTFQSLSFLLFYYNASSMKAEISVCVDQCCISKPRKEHSMVHGRYSSNICWINGLVDNFFPL